MFLKRLNRNSTLLKGGLYSLFSFFNQGVGFVLLIILAKFILPDEYGQLSLFNTIVMFLGYFIALSTEGYFSISYFKSSENDYKKDIGAITVLSTSICVVLLIVTYLFNECFHRYLYLSPYIIVLAIIICYSHIFVKLNLDYQRVRDNIISYGLISCSSAVLNFILSLLFVVGLQLSWYGRVYANVLCSVLLGVIGIVYLTKHRVVILSYSKERFNKLLIWGVPLIPHLATSWIRQGCDRYIINYYYSFSEVGLFSFALNLANIMEIVGSAFNSTNSVEIFKVLSDKEKTSQQKISILKLTTRRIFGIYIIILIVLLFGGICFVPIFLANYSAAIPYFMILVFYGFLRSIYFLYCNYLFFWNETRKLMYITFFTSLLHLVLSLLITKYSLFYTSIIYCLTQLIVVFLVYSYSVRLIKNNL